MAVFRPAAPRPSTSPRTLLLVRHAIAPPRGPEWPDDAARPLSRKGVVRMRAIVGGLRGAGVDVDVVMSSPLVRARQTADLLKDGLRGAPEVIETPALAPGRPLADVVDALATRSRAGVVALVGHEPGLGELAAWLLGTAQPIPFKKGGVCRLDFDRPVGPGAARLVWFAPPKLLRRLPR